MVQSSECKGRIPTNIVSAMYIDCCGITQQEGAKGSKYPMDPSYFKLSLNGTKLSDNEEYHSLIDSLLYLATNSRPDIAACVGILSRKISHPSDVDWTESQRIIRYLVHTMDYKLKLGKAEEKFELVGYSDADWAETAVTEDLAADTCFV